MPKKRKEIPSKLAAEVMFKSDSTCCVCYERGNPVQLHHVDENPNNNVEENLAVLCLLCHDRTQIKGGFGRKLNPELVLRHKADWEQRVEQRRAIAAKRVRRKPLKS